jgi:hypothetical protein
MTTMRNERGRTRIPWASGDQQTVSGSGAHLLCGDGCSSRHGRRVNDYHALQFSLNKRLARGLQFLSVIRSPETEEEVAYVDRLLVLQDVRTAGEHAAAGAIRSVQPVQHTWFGAPNVNVTNAAFGTVTPTQANDPRTSSSG